MAEPEGGAPAGDAGLDPPKTSQSRKMSRQRSKMAEALLSRANTMLRNATLSRERSAGAPAAAPVAASKEPSSIKGAIATLEREKTTLEATPEEGDKEVDDDEMKMFLRDMQKQKAKAKEFTDSDFDTDLEDEIGKYPVVFALLMYSIHVPTYQAAAHTV